jgi:hypothetical protein
VNCRNFRFLGELTPLSKDIPSGEDKGCR